MERRSATKVAFIFAWWLPRSFLIISKTQGSTPNLKTCLLWWVWIIFTMIQVMTDFLHSWCDIYYYYNSVSCGDCRMDELLYRKYPSRVEQGDHTITTRKDHAICYTLMWSFHPHNVRCLRSVAIGKIPWVHKPHINNSMMIYHRE